MGKHGNTQEAGAALRALVTLVEDDLHELKDQAAQIDDRLAELRTEVRAGASGGSGELAARLDDLHALGETRQAVAAARYLAFDARLSAIEQALDVMGVTLELHPNGTPAGSFADGLANFSRKVDA